MRKLTIGGRQVRIGSDIWPERSEWEGFLSREGIEDTLLPAGFSASTLLWARADDELVGRGMILSKSGDPTPVFDELRIARDLHDSDLGVHLVFRCLAAHFVLFDRVRAGPDLTLVTRDEFLGRQSLALAKVLRSFAGPVRRSGRG